MERETTAAFSEITALGVLAHPEHDGHFVVLVLRSDGTVTLCEIHGYEELTESLVLKLNATSVFSVPSAAFQEVWLGHADGSVAQYSATLQAAAREGERRNVQLTRRMQLQKKPVGEHEDDKEQQHRTAAPSSSIKAICVAEASRCVCAVDASNVLSVWNRDDGSLLRSQREKVFLSQHDYLAPVLCMLVVPNAQQEEQLWVGCDDGSLAVFSFDLFHGEASGEKQLGLRSAALDWMLAQRNNSVSAIRALEFVAAWNSVVCGCLNGDVTIWNAQTLSLVEIFPEHRAAVTSFVWVAWGMQLWSAAENGSLFIWAKSSADEEVPAVVQRIEQQQRKAGGSERKGEEEDQHVQSSPREAEEEESANAIVCFVAVQPLRLVISAERDGAVVIWSDRQGPSAAVEVSQDDEEQQRHEEEQAETVSRKKSAAPSPAKTAEQKADPQKIFIDDDADAAEPGDELAIALRALSAATQHMTAMERREQRNAEDMDALKKAHASLLQQYNDQAAEYESEREKLQTEKNELLRKLAEKEAALQSLGTMFQEHTRVVASRKSNHPVDDDYLAVTLERDALQTYCDEHLLPCIDQLYAERLEAAFKQQQQQRPTTAMSEGNRDTLAVVLQSVVQQLKDVTAQNQQQGGRNHLASADECTQTDVVSVSISPMRATAEDHDVVPRWLVDALQMQLRLVEQLLRQHREAVVGGATTRADSNFETSCSPPASTHILTQSYLTVREMLGTEEAAALLFDALRDEDVDEVEAMHRLIRALCLRCVASNRQPQQPQRQQQHGGRREAAAKTGAETFLLQSPLPHSPPAFRVEEVAFPATTGLGLNNSSSRYNNNNNGRTTSDPWWRTRNAAPHFNETTAARATATLPTTVPSSLSSTMYGAPQPHRRADESSSPFSRQQQQEQRTPNHAIRYAQQQQLRAPSPPHSIHRNVTVMW